MIPTFEEDQALDKIRVAWRALDDALGAFIGARYGDQASNVEELRMSARKAASAVHAELVAHEMLFGNCGPEPRGLLNADDG